MNDKELKPCPFCAGEAVVHEFCVSCSVHGCPASVLDCDVEEWNTRASANRILEAVDALLSMPLSKRSPYASSAPLVVTSDEIEQYLREKESNER